MKILHVSMEDFNDNFGYQENLLPKYHKKLGNEVVILTLNQFLGKNGTSEYCDAGSYINENGIRVIRIAVDQKSKITRVLGYYKIFHIVKEQHPDYIFVHNLFGIYVKQLAKYKREINPSCIIVADNHVDHYNDGYNPKNYKQRFVRRVAIKTNRYMAKYYNKVFGVTTGRTEYAHEVFQIPNELLDTLLLGSDTDQIDFEHQAELRQEMCNKLHIPFNHKIVICGGKLDKNKKVIELMDAFRNMNDSTCSLVLFGSIANDIEQEVKNRLNENIHLLGFLNEKEIFNALLSADLGVFPGGHSILWEQAIATGLPCIFRYWKGIEHVNLNGNCKMLQSGDEKEIEEAMNEILSDKRCYNLMKQITMERGRTAFSYYEIAKKSLEV